MLEWKNKRTGMVTSSIATCGAFFRSSPEVAIPDLQLVFVLGIVDDHARKMHLGHGISCHVDLLRPHSRGTVSLASTDPHDAPLIDPKFLSDERDLPVLVKGGQMQQRILESKPFDPIRGPMLYPVRADDAAAMAQDIRNRADTQYHPVGTCKMGPDSDPHGRGGCAAARARHRRPACRRCVHHADPDWWKYQCPQHHDRR
jgi:choline dehydrogenase-like flavoprotein